MSPVTRPRLLLAVLSAAIFVAVAALGLSVRNAFDQTRAERLRERDRIAADIAGCERGNDLRRQIISIAIAQEQLVVGILDEVFLEVDDPTVVAELEQRLEHRFDAYERAVEQIQITDCVVAVPGA